MDWGVARSRSQASTQTGQEAIRIAVVWLRFADALRRAPVTAAPSGSFCQPALGPAGAEPPQPSSLWG